MTDPQFGPVLLFGLGGVFVEALRDVSFRIIPITAADARRMLAGVPGLDCCMAFGALRQSTRTGWQTSW
jgi:hypothetical protein